MVVLVGKDEEPGRHALALERGERSQPVPFLEAVVEGAMDDERRRHPLVHEESRGPLIH